MKEPIQPENIRKDDLIRKEYHEPLQTTVAYEYYAQHDGDAANLTPASFFVLERAKSALPTAPGLYRVRESPHSKGTVQLNVDGEWWWVGNEYQPRPEKITAEYVAEFFMPLTPLGPVTGTAERVLDRVEEYLGSSVARAALNDLRREFGVQS